MNKSDQLEAEALVKRMIELIGDDPFREGLLKTPRRVVNSWSELFAGYNQEAEDCVKVFKTEFDQVVVLRGIDYFSVCEHHMVPFFGKVYIAYLPGEGRVIGVSKLARIVEVYARRLQIQENLTQQIADTIGQTIKPFGVAVVMDGTHFCMRARGVNQQHATLRTSYMLGAFRDDSKARAEVLNLMGLS